MKEGPLSKGDDSEIPRALTSIFYVARNRDFTEFMANLEFGSKDACAFLTSKMSVEKSSMVLTQFNRPDMWDGETEQPTSGRRR